MNALSTGEITYPLQTSFMATGTAAQTSVTGDGTTYTIQYTTEIFDQNNDFDGTSTFTAPVTGRYMMGTRFRLGNLGALFTSSTTNINTSNRSYFYTTNPGIIRDVANNLTLAISSLCDFDSADTATITISVSGSTKTIDVQATTLTNFYGFLEA